MWKSGQRAFQTKEATCAKALRWAPAWHVQRSARSGAEREGSREEHRGRDRTVSRAQRQQGKLGPGGKEPPTPVTEAGTRRPRGSLTSPSASAVVYKIKEFCDSKMMARFHALISSPVRWEQAALIPKSNLWALCIAPEDPQYCHRRRGMVFKRVGSWGSKRRAWHHRDCAGATRPSQEASLPAFTSEHKWRPYWF